MGTPENPSLRESVPATTHLAMLVCQTPNPRPGQFDCPPSLKETSWPVYIYDKGN